MFVLFHSPLKAKEKPLKIGLIQSPPFLILENNENIEGLCIDIWEKISDSLGTDNIYIVKDHANILDALDNHEIDLTIFPLTITSERMRKYYFSQPYFITSLSIATNVRSKWGFSNFLDNFFSVNFFKIVSLLFFVLLVFGFLVWVFERHQNVNHFSRGIKGIADGLWWSASTMTTVGYGDKVPKSFWGRFIAVIWMFTAVIIISSFTAAISSTLTISQITNNIDGLSDLRTIVVGTINGSSSATYLDKNHIAYISYEDVDNAFDDLESGKIQAFVYHKAIIEYYLSKKQYRSDLTNIALDLNKEYFCFASLDAALIQRINPYLADVLESPSWGEMLKKYNLSE